MNRTGTTDTTRRCGAATPSRLSRRAICLGGTALASAAAFPAGLEAGTPDAELIRLYGEFRRNWDAFGAQADDDEGREERAAALHSAYWDAADAMMEIEPATLAGLCAKAQVYLVATEDGGGAYEDLATNLAADCKRLARIQCPAAVRALEGVQS